MLKSYMAHRVLSFSIIVLISASIFLSGCGKTQTDIKVGVNPYEGSLAPDFELESLAGDNIKLSDLLGKTVVINFWSLGCGYCLQEMPDFQALDDSKPEDVVILMINLDRDLNRINAYIKDQGFTFCVLKDETGDVARSYLIRGIPTTFVVNNDGIVIHRIEGAVNLERLNNII